MDSIGLQHMRMKHKYFHEEKWKQMIMLKSENRWLVRSSSDSDLYVVCKRDERMEKCDCEK